MLPYALPTVVFMTIYVLAFYFSIDTPEDPENNFVNYGPELLNKMEPTGVPPHELELKIGAPVLRNLDPPTVVNGTRLVIKMMHQNLLECTLLTGAEAARNVLIPRIPIEPSDTPIKFKRLQFPLRLCILMSLNKSQACILPFSITLELFY